jgi:hypothetical protein
LAQSPGLAQRAYPGKAVCFFINPNGVVPAFIPARGTTPLGLFPICDRYPG